MTLTESRPARGRRNRCHITVLTDRCAGCQECVVRCPTGALGIDPDRWVVVADEAACVGCRQCERTCPFSAIAVAGPVLNPARTETGTEHPIDILGDNAEIRRGLAGWEEALYEASRCLRCPDPTCVRGCPAHNDIPGFIDALASGDLGHAHDVLRRTTVMPDVCSRVCDQAVQCEGACTWSLAGDSAVAIGALERFVADNEPVPPVRALSVSAGGISVGIVGSGPAAIGAAHELLAAGASVTVYEADDRPGGMLNWGIPDFTLPRSVRERPWLHLIEAGAEVRCGTRIGPDDLEELLVRHDAVILAHGAGVALGLPVPGATLPGVEDATTFLHRAKAALDHDSPPADMAQRVARQSTVLVLGAGNTAMDVARSAVRLGARPICVDWMDRRFAPVRPDELAEAEAEGVEVRFSATLLGLEPGSDGRVRRARIAKTVQRSAAARPEVVEGSDQIEQVDLVVTAMGYRLDPSLSALLPGTPVPRRAGGIPDRRWQASGILANPSPDFARRRPVGELALGREVGVVASALPYRERTWVAGDALVGPSTVVEAMSQGRRAALAVIDAQPRRPERSDTRTPPRVLIAYQSRGGRTRAAAEAIAAHLGPGARSVTTLPMEHVGPAELAECDMLVVGTWVEGMVVAGVGPARATRRWLASLPHLPAMKVAVFCTYAVTPRSTLAVMRRLLEDKGADLVAEAAFGRRGGTDADGGGPARLASAMLDGQRRLRSAIG